MYIPIGNGATVMPPVLDEEHSCSAELCCARLNLASNSFFQVNKHFILRTSKSSLKNKFNRSALLLFLLFNVFCSSRQVDKIEISRKSGKKVFFLLSSRPRVFFLRRKRSHFFSSLPEFLLKASSSDVNCVFIRRLIESKSSLGNPAMIVFLRS